MSQFLVLPQNIYVGNYHACDEQSIAVPNLRTIHILHDEIWANCKKNIELNSEEKNASDDLFIRWNEVNPPTKKMLQAVWGMAKEDGPLFLHCSAGVSRSPSLSIVAMAARGVEVNEAIGVITKAMINEYSQPTVPKFYAEPLEAILSWIENR